MDGKKGPTFCPRNILTNLINSALELEQFNKDPTIPETKKKQKMQDIRRAEAHYLRFLRTKERVDNFNTLKIIGKGAFGEVRLVTRKTDGKVYALKSLIKSEMVSPSVKVIASYSNPIIVQERPTSSCSI
jgi:serine/threonine protein kinase